jgi:hypothetical protein
MELDSRKNEAKADLKQQDISIEVSSNVEAILLLIMLSLMTGIIEQGHC